MGKWSVGLRIMNLGVVVAGVVCVGGAWLILGRQLPPQIPLWYSRPWGEGQLAGPENLLFVPVMVIIIGLTLGWGAERMERDILLAQILLATAIVANLILTFGVLRIFWVVV